MRQNAKNSGDKTAADPPNKSSNKHLALVINNRGKLVYKQYKITPKHPQLAKEVIRNGLCTVLDNCKSVIIKYRLEIIINTSPPPPGEQHQVEGDAVQPRQHQPGGGQQEHIQRGQCRGNRSGHTRAHHPRAEPH